MTIDTIKLTDILTVVDSSERAYEILKQTGSHTLNFTTHDPEKAKAAFYNVAPQFLLEYNMLHDENMKFYHGERKAFSNMLYNYFMENEF